MPIAYTSSQKVLINNIATALNVPKTAAAKALRETKWNPDYAAEVYVTQTCQPRTALTLR